MMRLDKILSTIGVGSRKDVKKIIRAKRVSVNDQIVVDDDFKVDELNDVIAIDGEVVAFNKDVYIMLNKPDGYVSANEDNYDPTVFELIDDKTKNLFCVGRLDKDTEGLLFITNDGDLAHKLLSPKKNVYKKYYVEIESPLTDEDIELLQGGTIVLDGTTLKKAIVEVISDDAIYLSIMEGKYHQVKRMLEACKNKVTYLKRISMASLVLDEALELGQYRYLTPEEIKSLKGL